MSRVGKVPIPVPAGVTVTVAGNRVVAKGPKGELAVELPGQLTCAVNDGKVVVDVLPDAPRGRALHGLFRTLIANMIVGVTEGFQKRLEVVGVGYRAELVNGRLKLQLGFSHPVVFVPPAGITFEVPTPNNIVVKGIDKALVGQVAAKVRSLKPPEPYKGKGIRYEGEHVRKKAGKSGA
ncbi:MAG: 50S ribosomal protein L6 [candidate division KSB1 bacterium]|nr:50S ribosomal protein L6 [candidate division KSB1 bacterium]